MQSKRKTTTDSTYQGYPILTDEKKGLAIDTDLMQKIIKQFEYAEYDKSKVFFYRFDLHFPKDMGTLEAPQDNEHFKRFISAYQKNLSRKGLSPQYIAVREQRKSSAPHYHVGIFAAGQKTRNCYGHIKTAERLWERELGLEADGTHGLVNYCDKDKMTGERMVNGMMIDATKDNYEIVKDKCVERASYLAKVNQKNAPKGQREYFASRLPKDYR